MQSFRVRFFTKIRDRIKNPDLVLVKKRTLRFFDEDDYEYKIFSILSIAQAWTSVILAGKRDSRRYTTTSFSKEVVVAGTSYQM